MDNQPNNQPQKPEDEQSNQPKPPFSSQPETTEGQADDNSSQLDSFSSPQQLSAETPAQPPASNWQSGEAEPQTAPDPNASPMASPSANPSSSPQMSAAGSAPKKGKKGLLAIILAAALVVLGGGGALAYNLWYQNPDKVVSDALMNALSAETLKYKGTMKVEGKNPGSITFDGVAKNGTGTLNVSVNIENEGQAYSIKGGGIFDDKGDLYVKASNLDEAYSKLAESQPNKDPAINKIYGDFITKINDKWVKISADGLKQFSETLAKNQQCVRDTFKKIQEDQNMSAEIAKLYEEHKFIVIEEELGSKDGSLGYLVSQDETKAKAFGEAFKKTEAYKAMEECAGELGVEDKQKVEDTTSQQEGEDRRIEVWVSRWSHEITKLSVQAKDTKESRTTTMTLEPIFNEPVTVTAPQESISTDEVIKAFQELQLSILQYRIQQQGGRTLFSGGGSL